MLLGLDRNTNAVIEEKCKARFYQNYKSLKAKKPDDQLKIMKRFDDTKNDYSKILDLEATIMAR